MLHLNCRLPAKLSPFSTHLVHGKTDFWNTFVFCSSRDLPAKPDGEIVTKVAGPGKLLSHLPDQVKQIRFVPLG